MRRRPQIRLSKSPDDARLRSRKYIERARDGLQHIEYWRKIAGAKPAPNVTPPEEALRYARVELSSLEHVLAQLRRTLIIEGPSHE